MEGMYESTASLVNVVCDVSAALRAIFSFIIFSIGINQNSRYHKRYNFPYDLC